MSNVSAIKLRSAAVPQQGLDLSGDMDFVERVLARFQNPWDRHFLTLAIDATADALEHRNSAMSAAERVRADLAQMRVAHALKAAHVGQFRSNGYVKLEGFLSSSEVEMLRAAVNAGIETFEASPNSYNVTAAADALWGTGAGYDNKTSMQHDLGALAKAVKDSDRPRLLDPPRPGQPRGSFLLDTGVWRRVPALADFALRGPLPAVSADLLDLASIRFFDDQIFVKEAGAVDRTAFHQDLAYFHLGGSAGCVFWIPLDPVRRGGGRMAYVPGSHLWKQVFKPNIFASETPFPGSEGLDMPDIDADPDSFGVQYIEAEPGDVLVHHLLAIHGSEGNRGGTQRRAISLRYIDAAMPYRHRAGAPPQPLHRANVTDGAPLDNAIHPVVWPPTAPSA